MDQNQAQAVSNLFPVIVQALTTIAALLAAFAAFHAASKSSKTAVYQPISLRRLNLTTNIGKPSQPLYFIPTYQILAERSLQLCTQRVCMPAMILLAI